MIEVTFTDETSITISSIDQWTTGNMLKVSGLSLNDKFTVSYSHSAMSITDFTVDRLGRTYDKYSVVPIPNRLFEETGTITVLFDKYSVIVPVSSATKPTDYDSKYKCDTDTDACMIAELVKNGSSSTETVGSKTVPIYLNAGTFEKCTSLSLNTTGTSAYSTATWVQTWSGKCNMNSSITCTIPTTAKAIIMRWYLNGYYSTIYLPRTMITTTATKYIVSDDTEYGGGQISISGTTLTYKGTGQNNNYCYLDKVYYKN